MSDDVLASDQERDQVVSRLQRAHQEGRLTEEELAQRVESALRSRTRGELRRLSADLPNPEDGSPRQHERAELRPVWIAWGIASSVNLVIWAIISLTTGQSIYPWFLWVAGPWGAVLLVLTLANRRG